VIPSRQVDIHPEAIAEAQAAHRWYRERSASAAEAYLAELDLAVEAIAKNPEMCPNMFMARGVLFSIASLSIWSIGKLPVGLKSSLWPTVAENLDTGKTGLPNTHFSRRESLRA